jgi:hypothetical protein
MTPKEEVQHHSMHFNTVTVSDHFDKETEKHGVRDLRRFETRHSPTFPLHHKKGLPVARTCTESAESDKSTSRYWHGLGLGPSVCRSFICTCAGFAFIIVDLHKIPLPQFNTIQLPETI